MKKFNESGRELSNNEVFTDPNVGADLIRKIKDLDLYDSNKRILEPCAGTGDFIQGIINVLMEDFGHSFETAQSMIHAVEWFPDNCVVIRSRFPLVKLWHGDFLNRDSWVEIPIENN